MDSTLAVPTYGINLIVYGDAKVGKSWLGATTPAPRLILDAEGGSHFTPGRKTVWNPLAEAPPVPSDAWETAIVDVRDYATMERAYQWLHSGQHGFRSVTIDSISEIQQRAVDQIAGRDQMKQQDWGALLRNISSLIRSCRDLTRHPTNPLDAVVFLAMEQVHGPQQKIRPFMQGQMGQTFPYFVDVCAYLDEVLADDSATYVHRLYTSRIPGYVTGERVGGCLGRFIDNPTIADMITTIRAYMERNHITLPDLVPDTTDQQPQ